MTQDDTGRCETTLDSMRQREKTSDDTRSKESWENVFGTGVTGNDVIEIGKLLTDSQ